MSKQKYFYRGWDMVKLISSEFNLFITSIFALVGLLCFFITPSYSLGWQDEEWLKPGCPKTVSGNWAVDNLTNRNLKLLSINNKEFIYISKNDQKHKFRIIGRISMDTITIDISKSNKLLKIGQYVEIINYSHGIEELAKQCETISNEILTSISNRVQRIYK